MRLLANTLDTRAVQLIKTCGAMPESQLLAMLCVLLAEDRYQLEKQVPAAAADPQMTQQLNRLAGKIMALAESLDS